MSNTNTVALRDMLKSIEGEVGGLRDRKTAAVRDREEAVAKLTAVPGSPDQSRPSFKAARRAADEVNDLSVKLDEAVSTQSGVLKMLGEQVIDAPTGDPSRVDVRKTGGWLARELRKSLTTDNIGSIDDTARRCSPTACARPASSSPPARRSSTSPPPASRSRPSPRPAHLAAVEREGPDHETDQQDRGPRGR